MFWTKKILSVVLVFLFSLSVGHKLSPILEPLAYRFLSPSGALDTLDQLPVVVSLDFLYGPEAGNPDPENPISSKDYKALFAALKQLKDKNLAPASMGFDVDFSRTENSFPNPKNSSTAISHRISDVSSIASHLAAVKEAKSLNDEPENPIVFFGVGRQAFSQPSQWWENPDELQFFANTTPPTEFPYGNLDNRITADGKTAQLASMAKAVGDAYRRRLKLPTTDDRVWKRETQPLPGVLAREFLVDYTVIPKLVESTIFPKQAADGSIVFSESDISKLNGRMAFFGQTLQKSRDMIVMTTALPANDPEIVRGVYGNAACAYSYAVKPISQLSPGIASWLEILSLVVAFIFGRLFLRSDFQVSNLNRCAGLFLKGVYLLGCSTIIWILGQFVWNCLYGPWQILGGVIVAAFTIALCLTLIEQYRSSLYTHHEQKTLSSLLKFALVGAHLIIASLLLRFSILHLGLFSGILFTVLDPLIEPVLDSLVGKEPDEAR